MASETEVKQDNQIILYKEIKTVITIRTIITTVVREKINKNNNFSESTVLFIKNKNVNNNTEIRNLDQNPINFLQDNELDVQNQTTITSNDLHQQKPSQSRIKSQISIVKFDKNENKQKEKSSNLDENIIFKQYRKHNFFYQMKKKKFLNHLSWLSTLSSISTAAV
jgi:hypothetical protein